MDQEGFEAVQYLEDKRAWLLTTRHTAYALGLNEGGQLLHLYWGDRLPYPADYPGLGRPETYAVENGALRADEYPAWGGFMYSEPCLKATFADGVRDQVLVYARHRQETGPDGLPVLVITLKDSFYSLEVDLHYRVVAESDLIVRWAVVRNSGSEPFDLKTALSAAWQMPALHDGSYRLTHLSGRWGAETLINQNLVTDGRLTLDSRRNMSSAEQNPFFALDVVSPTAPGATEEAGGVWFGAIEWSGNWQITVEQVSRPTRVYVAGGVNAFDFSWRLEAGEEYATPAFVGGYTAGGFGQASRNLHRYQLDHLLPRAHARKIRPVLYNSWEAVLFNVTEAAQIALAERAARLGVELFVIDDGWFGQRKDDHAGLGDWYINQEKFPQGLNPLIERVNDLGMDFGIWVEPEMVNPDSDLYRAHPEWVYHFPNRSRSEGRFQLMLNLARPDVAAYTFDWLDRLLADHNISFVKWDFNRAITEPGWPEAPAERQREIYVRHVLALYGIVDRLRERHPGVTWEVCASGGGRADLGAFAHFDQCWVSDNTDPFDRLLIQEGYSLAYAPKTMMAWVTGTTWSAGPGKAGPSLKYRFHSAMTGSVGLGENLNHYSEEQMSQVAALVEEYKGIRHIVQEGDLYRLSSPRSSHLTAVQYVTRDRAEAVVLAFLHSQHFWQGQPRLYLRGLEPARLYTVEGRDEPPASGQSLMSLGLKPNLDAREGSVLIRLRAVAEV